MDFKKILFLISSILFCSPAYAGSGSGTVGLQFLNNDFSARALGMGGAFVSIADGVDAIDYNPAGLGQIKYPELSAMYLSGFDDASLGSLKFGMLLPNVGFAKYARPAVAVSVISSDAGDMELRQLDTPTISKKIKAQQDYSISLSYAEKFFVGDILLEKLRFEDIEQFYGINAKYIRSTIVDEYTGDGVAGDIGYLLKHNRSGVSFGAAFGNLGSGVKYIEETTKMPAVARAGLSWITNTLYGQKIRVAYQGDFHLNEDYYVSRVGAEYLFDQYVDVRIGYIANPDNPAFTLGITLKYDDISMDFAGTVGDNVYNNVMASVNYRFSGLAYKSSPVKKKKLRGIEDRTVADPVGGKKKPANTQGGDDESSETTAPARTEKSTGNAGLFLIY